ncbi:MAG: hypothetical protein ACFFCS_19855 [Candidatus Hodarchaeota archaeon]
MRTKHKLIIGIILLAIVVPTNILIMADKEYPKQFMTSYGPVIVFKPLPDPFLMENGTRVSTLGEWNVRREEIKDLILDIEYGTMPGIPEQTIVNINSTNNVTASTYSGTYNETKLYFTFIPNASQPSQNFSMNVSMYLPNPTSTSYPVVLRVGPWFIQEYEIVIERGYAFVSYEYEDLDPDPKDGQDVVGSAQVAYPSHTWGSLAVWAWGAMRVVDYLYMHPSINESQILVTGHSRAGKVALLAGALDERIEISVPNGAGTGGSGSYIVQGPNCETMHTMLREDVFSFWYNPAFRNYIGKEHLLPFDQHFLRALIVPRCVLDTDAFGDNWANPVGTQAMYQAAQPVFDFLGASNNNSIHFREGQHDQLNEDFLALLDYADLKFFNISTSRSFDQLPFPEFPIQYSWTAP